MIGIFDNLILYLVERIQNACWLYECLSQEEEVSCRHLEYRILGLTEGRAEEWMTPIQTTMDAVGDYHKYYSTTRPA